MTTHRGCEAKKRRRYHTGLQLSSSTCLINTNPAAAEKTSDLTPASLLIHTLAPQSRLHTHLSDMLLHDHGGERGKAYLLQGVKGERNSKKKGRTT